VAKAQGEVDSTGDADQEIRRLLDTATAAYEAADFAKAADLGDQVMRRLSETAPSSDLEGAASVKFPERALENPLAFRVRMNSHVRGGPGMSFAPRAILPAKTGVTGLATRGQWVKITAPGEVQGWIYRKLLVAPD
jgi:hypothetical protein